MNNKELAERLASFRDGLTAHRSLYARSVEEFIPTRPVRNGEKLEKQQRELARQLAVLEPYLDVWSPGRVKVHRASGNAWDIFRSAIGNDIALIKGDSINDSILQLEGMIALIESKPGDEIAQLETHTQVQPTNTGQGGSRDSHSIQISGGNVNIGDHGTINLEVNVADFLKAAVARLEERSSSPEEIRTLSSKLRALLEHPLGRLLTQIGVGEVLKHI